MAKVTFRRFLTDNEARSSDIIDGQFIVTKDGKSYIDYGTDRVPTNGTLDKQMSDTSLNGVENKVIKKYIDDNINQTKQYSKDYTDTKTKRQVATIYLSTDVSNVGTKKIPFNMINSNSENLTLSSNGIKIGKGISKILVSGAVFLSKNSSAYLWTHIMVNNTEVSIALDNTSSGFASTSHSPKIASVQENDIIYLGKTDDDIGVIRGKTNTYLTVEVIE